MSGFTARQEVVAFRYVELRSATLAAMGTLSLLDREMFAEAEAARLLQLHQSTLHYWLEGREMRGRHYQPIIRPAATGSRIVTWAEFIEAGLLRSYRSKRVPMAELRAFIDLLRQEYGVPYPLAHEAPLVSDASSYFKLRNKPAWTVTSAWSPSPTIS